MSSWNFGTNNGTFTLSLSVTGEIGMFISPGTVWYEGIAFPVTGNWVASAPNLGHTIAFSLSGTTSPPPNPLFLSASGSGAGTGSSPTSIEIYVTQVTSANGAKEEWSGSLEPNAAWPSNISTGPWYLMENGNVLGVIQLSLASSGQQLSATATWQSGVAGSSQINVGVTWYDGKLIWWAGGILYESQEFSSTSRHGTYGDQKRQNGTWTGSQSR